MEQYNRTTKPVFTTNWYIYRTHAYQLCAKPQEHNTKPTNNQSAQKRNENSNLKTNIFKNTDDFEEILLEAIDEGLSLIGESAKKVVYAYLEKMFKMSKEDIPYRIEDYTRAIEEIFGTGAKIIQIKTMRSLYKKVAYPIKQYPEEKSLTFTEYVATMKHEKEQRENINSQQPN